jgi:hypothetical protein
MEEEKRTHNFIDETTGEKFFFTNYTIGFKGSEPIYKDKFGKVLINPKNGLTLNLIPKKVDDYSGVFFMGTENERSIKHEKTFKQIAKDHAKSDENLDIRYKSIEKQMGTDAAVVQRKIDKETILKKK